VKVALLTSAYGADDGVVGIHVQGLARAIARAGGTADVLLHAPNHVHLPPEERGVSITRFPSWIPGNEYAISRRLWSYLREHSNDFDVIHVHGESVVPPLLVAGSAARHVIFTPHLYASPQPHLRQMIQRRDRRVGRQVLAQADRVLCVSESEATQVKRYAPNAQVRIVPQTFDADAIAAARPFAIDGKIILTVDRLTRWAGIHRVISALPALDPSYRLVVAGQGRGRKMLEAHADYLGVFDRVRFVGAVSDAVLYRWLRTASVVASLKEESLWPGTLLMAACAGVRIVASDIAVNREAAALIGGEDGIAFVSRRASPLVIADAVSELAQAETLPSAPLMPRAEDTTELTVAIYRELVEHPQLRLVEPTARGGRGGTPPAIAARLVRRAASR
jgi:glycosyltransferase involved in cell wall biosynthesis